MTGLEELFHQANELAPADRARFLSELDESDAPLAVRLRELLSAHAVVSEMEAVVDELSHPEFAGSSPSAAPPTDLSRWLLRGKADAVPDSDLIGRRVGHYTITRVLGAGGMGVVCAARQDSPDRLVALKLLHLGLSSAAARERFAFEARVLARLRHPGIAQVYEAGTDTSGGIPIPWFALELIEGGRDLLAYAESAALDLRGRVSLFCLVLDAVDHGHRRGIIHRDLKPSNILVDPKGRPKLIDFGIARALDDGVAGERPHTLTGAHLGTPEYMSPEQALGSKAGIDTRSDVYSLGVVLYRLLSGSSPYRSNGSVPFEAFIDVTTRPPVPLVARSRELRGDLSTIVGKALAKDPEARYATAGELARDLRRWLGHEPIEARRPTTLRRVALWARRRRGPAAAVAALIVVAGVAAGLLVRSYSRERDSREAAVFALDRGRLTNAASALARHDAATARVILDAIGGAAKSGPLAWGYGLVENDLDLSIAEWSPSRGGPGRDQLSSFAWIAGDHGEELVAWDDAERAPVAIGPDGSRRRIEFSKLPPDPPEFAPQMVFGNGATSLGIGFVDASDQSWDLWGTTRADGESPLVPIAPQVEILRNQPAFHPSGDSIAYAGSLSWQSLPLGPSAAAQESLPLQDCDSFACSHSGDLLLAGLGDPPALAVHRSRSAGGFEHLQSFPAHDYRILAIAFAPGDDPIATASNDGSIRLWSQSDLLRPSAPLPLDHVDTHPGGVSALAFHPHLPLLVSGGFDHTLRFWRIEAHAGRDLSRGMRLVSAGVLHGHRAMIQRIEFSPNGERLVSSDGTGQVLEWPAVPCDPHPMFDHRSSSVTSCGWLTLADGLEVIHTAEHREIRFWDPRSGDLRGTIRVATNPLSPLVSVPGKPWFASRTGFGTIEIFEAARRRGERGDEIERRTLVESGERRALSYGLGSVDVYSTYGRALLSQPVWRSPGDLRIAGSVTSGEFEIHDLRVADAGLEPVSVRKLGHRRPQWQDRISAIGLAAGGRLLVLGIRSEPGEKDRLEIWDLERGLELRGTELDSPLTRALAHPDSRSPRVVLGLESGEILVLDDAADAGAPLRTLSEAKKAHDGAVWALAAHPQHADRLFSGGNDRMIKAWEIGPAPSDPILEFTEAGSGVAHIAFDPTGDLLLSGGSGNMGAQNVARLWDARLEPVDDRVQLAARARSEYLWAEGQRLSRAVSFPPGLLEDQIEFLRRDPALVEGIESPEWQERIREAAVRYRRSRGPLFEPATRWILRELRPGVASERAELAYAEALALASESERYGATALLGGLIRTGRIEAARDLDRDLPIRVPELRADPLASPFAIELHCFRALLHAPPLGDEPDRAAAHLATAERLFEAAPPLEREEAAPLLEEARARVGGR